MSTTHPSRDGKIPVVIYGAKSTDDVRGSIPTQLADCRAAVEREGDRDVIGEFSDEARSAYHGNRGDNLARAKEAAIAAARATGSAELWVQHSDRLARGDGRTADHLAEVFFAMRKENVRLRSEQDDSNLEDAIRAVLIGERNHEDSRRKALAVQAGMRRRRASGMHNGGPRKFGYDYVRDAYGRTVPEQPFLVVRAEAVIVVRIYRDYTSGVSQQAIQRALNREGLRTARGKTWYQGTIAKILADPWYAGLVPAEDGTFIPGRHEAIVDLDLWQEAARIRGDGRRTFHRGGRPPSREFLFTNGSLRCGRCDGAMVPRTVQRTSPKGKPWGRPYEVYRCMTRIRDVSACDQRAVPRAAVDQAALAALEARGLSVEQTRRQAAEAVTVELRAIDARVADAVHQERRAEGRLERIERDYTDGDLSAANYERMQATLSVELEGARAEREQLEQHAARIKEAAADADGALVDGIATLRQAIAEHLQSGRDVDEVRFVLRRLFAGFVVRDVDGGIAIVPELRPDAIDTLTDGVEIPRRETLRVTTAYDGLPTALVVGAIPVPPAGEGRRTR